MPTIGLMGGFPVLMMTPRVLGTTTTEPAPASGGTVGVATSYTVHLQQWNDGHLDLGTALTTTAPPPQQIHPIVNQAAIGTPIEAMIALLAAVIIVERGVVFVRAMLAWLHSPLALALG